MPRSPRAISSTDIYHTVLRGINQSVIFEENSDYSYFKTLLLNCCTRYSVKIYAYCLMNNHVHLLIHSPASVLELFFKSLEIRYAIWFNAKYQRSGHLFQNRFFSIPVESEDYFLRALRYIHFNPKKAGIIDQPHEYPWSSCISYYFGFEDELLAKEDFFKMTGFPSEPGNMVFCTVDETAFIEPVEKHRLLDEEGIRLMQEISGCCSHAQFQNLEKPKRNKSIQSLYKKGLSVRQLVRICGVSKSTVERILGMKK